MFVPSRMCIIGCASATMGAMNKRELAKAVAVQADVELKTVVTVIDGFTDVVTAVVSKGEPVSIPGFAKFVKVDRPARMGRNPATGEAIRIKASKKARITPVKAFKDAVLAPAKAPKLVKGAFPTDRRRRRGRRQVRRSGGRQGSRQEGPGQEGHRPREGSGQEGSGPEGSGEEDRQEVASANGPDPGPFDAALVAWASTSMSTGTRSGNGPLPSRWPTDR